MNERLKGFIKAAGLDDDAFPIDEYDNPQLETFAELIVLECIEVMVKNDYHGEWLGEKIKEHFGVK
jgi:hypothetical protein